VEKGQKVIKLQEGAIYLGEVKEVKESSFYRPISARVHWIRPVSSGSSTNNCSQDEDLEWVDGEKLVVFDPEELFESLSELYREDYNALPRLQRMCVSAYAARFLAGKE